MILQIETIENNTLIIVEELKHSDKKQLDSVLAGLNFLYPYYMKGNQLIHLNGFISQKNIEIYDFYTFVKQFKGKENDKKQI